MLKFSHKGVKNTQTSRHHFNLASIFYELAHYYLTLRDNITCLYRDKRNVI